MTDPTDDPKEQLNAWLRRSLIRRLRHMVVERGERLTTALERAVRRELARYERGRRKAEQPKESGT